MSTPIRIVLVDDHKLVRDAWKILLGHHPEFDIIADCDNGLDALALADRLTPDIMIVDINMYPLNGFEVTEKMVRAHPGTRIIGLSVNNQPRYAQRMLELGASGFLTKTSSLDEIKEGITRVHKGEVYVCDEIKRNMD